MRSVHDSGRPLFESGAGGRRGTHAARRFDTEHSSDRGVVPVRAGEHLGADIMDARMLRRISSVLMPLAAAGFCAAADTKFSGELYPVLQKANCRTCHVDG